MVSFEIRGTNRVKNQLRTIAAIKPEIADPVIGKHAKQEQRELKNTPYPPYQAHFTHTRKRFFGGIAGSFSAKRKAVAVWEVTNSRDYAKYVIGEQQLSHPSFRAWWKMKDEMAKRMPMLVKSLTAELEKELDKG